MKTLTNKRRLLAVFLLCALLSALLCGCVEGERAQVKEGKRLIKAYLSDHRGSRIEECRADILRPDADKLVLSDFVKGTFREGGESYEFSVNVKTGEIYTGEQLPAFSESCARLLAKRLGLAEYTADCTVWMDAPAWQEPKEEWPDEMTYLGEVLPVGIEDMDAYAAQAIADGNVRILLKLAVPRSQLAEDRWSLEDTKGWNDTEVQLFGFDGALPTQEALSVLYFADYEGVLLYLNEKEIRFCPGK